uniref:Tripartite motif containing 50 n=1 Tax=Cyclopterus lumpus TaxID=8103 RepID=A0A8C2WUP8_CYCLU
MERRQSLEDQLRRPVCLDVFTEPLMLQCGHSYCRCCVRSMTMDLLGQLQCPVCGCAVDGDSPPPNVSLVRIIDALQEVSVSGAQSESCPQHHNSLSLYCLSPFRLQKYGSIAPRFREIQELQKKEERIFSSLNFKTGFNHNDIKLTVWKRLQRKVLPAPELMRLDPQTAHPMLELLHRDTGSVTVTVSWPTEVEVANKPKWRLGLIKGTTNRKAKLGKNPESGVWLIGLKDGVYEAFSSPRVVLPVPSPPHRVGLFLDYEGRGLTFYNSDSPDELSFIYSFKLEVQGKVYPLLDVCWHDRRHNKKTLVLPQPHKEHLLYIVYGT